jgi:uncharacterized protein (TIGR02599 family)
MRNISVPLLVKNNLNQGFTLVELILYMAIFSILLIIMVQMFGSVFDIQTETEATSSVAQDGRYILNRMSYDLMQAQALLVVNSSALNFVVSGSTDSYYFSNGNLEFTNGLSGATDQLNSSDTNITSLIFTKAGNVNGKSTVQVIFTLTGKTIKSSGIETKTFETTLGTR